MMVRAHRQSAGMALIAVLWIVAALSVLVTGMAQTVRQQIGVAATLRDEVSGQALGEAAIALTLQALQVSGERPQRVERGVQQFDGVQMEVEVAPLDGLIALNGAGVSVLASALEVAGGLDQGAAQALAKTMVEWRDARAENGDRHYFEAVEDLLMVPGIDYGLYARLRPLFSAVGRGSGVNPMAAPPAVLAVLAGGNAGRVADLVQRRDAGDVGIDTTGLDQGMIGRSATTEYRISVGVPLGAGKMLLLTHDIDLRPAPTGAPWRVFSVTRRIAAGFPA